MTQGRVICWLLVLVGAVGAARAGEDAPEDVAVLQLESFDRVWELVRDRYPDPTLQGVDWEAERARHRPHAAEAATASELRPVLASMLATLDSSHLTIIAGDMEMNRAWKALGSDPNQLGKGDLGLELRVIDGYLLVSHVAPGSAAEEAGVQPGWALAVVHKVAIQDFVEHVRPYVEARYPGSANVDDMVAQALEMLANGGPSGKQVLTFVDGNDRPRKLRIPCQPARWTDESMYHGASHHPIRWHHQVLPDSSVGYLRFNQFAIPVPELFEGGLRELDEAGVEGLIVDLRGNVGGYKMMTAALAGYLSSDVWLSLGTFISREGENSLLVAPRDTAGYDRKPVAVLVDQRSASAAEIFAIGLRDFGRVRLFGERTSGEVIASLGEPLPNGDTLVLPVEDFLTPSGTAVEGIGVRPDEIVAPTREDLLAGRDPVVEAARAWLEDPDRREPSVRATSSYIDLVRQEGDGADPVKPDEPDEPIVGSDDLLPDAREVLRRHRATMGGHAAYEEHDRSIQYATIRPPGHPAPCQLTTYRAAPRKMIERTDCPSMPVIERGYIDGVGWMIHPITGTLALTGDSAEIFHRAAAFDNEYRQLEHGLDTMTVSLDRYGDREAYAVRSEEPDGVVVRYYDVESGVLLAAVMQPGPEQVVIEYGELVFDPDDFPDLEVPEAVRVQIRE